MTTIIFIKGISVMILMATDTEEFESAIMIVCSAYNDLQRVNPNHPLLSLIELKGYGFIHNLEYQERYVRPNLKSPDGQLCLWDWVYPNQFEAKIIGLLDYNCDLSKAIRTEISKKELDGIVGVYS